MPDKIVLQGKSLSKHFGSKKNLVKAVDNVSFTFNKSEIISIVGESGSGKTTLAKLILGLLKPSAGTIYYKGQQLQLTSVKERKNYWREVQAIFQDPFSSFNQFYKIEKMLQDCLNFKGFNISRQECKEKMEEAAGFVNLPFSELQHKYPFELSGGQRQRLMIARIFLLKPKVLIADEPTSMIDDCSRATILDMLMKLRKERQTVIVFITHDLGLAYYVSDTIYIMENGKIVESGNAKNIIENGTHTYTKQLLQDIPKLHEPWLD
ncbi:MAG TPA: ABC transporter ATP-binding protein [Spirochaetota bacterium]|nr:ABC transporter ATP-binding protein [Spirochaetota bacterium]